MTHDYSQLFESVFTFLRRPPQASFSGRNFYRDRVNLLASRRTSFSPSTSMKSNLNDMASTLALCLLMLGPLFLQVDGLSVPHSHLSDLISPNARVSDDGLAMAVTERYKSTDAVDMNQEKAVQTEARGALYTAEILTTKITELRQKYGVGAVVQENSLVLQAFNSINPCASDRSGNEMRVYIAGSNWAEETGVASAWESWQDQLTKEDFLQKYDMWIATRPQWQMVGCAWGRYCEDGSRGLSCMFWDANNNGTLGPPEI